MTSVSADLVKALLLLLDPHDGALLELDRLAVQAAARNSALRPPLGAIRRPSFPSGTAKPVIIGTVNIRDGSSSPVSVSNSMKQMNSNATGKTIAPSSGFLPNRVGQSPVFPPPISTNPRGPPPLPPSFSSIAPQPVALSKKSIGTGVKRTSAPEAISLSNNRRAISPSSTPSVPNILTASQSSDSVLQKSAPKPTDTSGQLKRPADKRLSDEGVTKRRRKPSESNSTGRRTPRITLDSDSEDDLQSAASRLKNSSPLKKPPQATNKTAKTAPRKRRISAVDELFTSGDSDTEPTPKGLAQKSKPEKKRSNTESKSADNKKSKGPLLSTDDESEEETDDTEEEEEEEDDDDLTESGGDDSEGGTKEDHEEDEVGDDDSDDQNPFDFCMICDKDTEEDGNEIVVCDNDECGKGYHQLCLDPPVLDEELDNDEDWYCMNCRDIMAKKGKNVAKTNSNKVRRRSAAGDKAKRRLAKKKKIEESDNDEDLSDSDGDRKLKKKGRAERAERRLEEKTKLRQMQKQASEILD